MEIKCALVVNSFFGSSHLGYEANQFQIKTFWSKTCGFQKHNEFSTRENFNVL